MTGHRTADTTVPVHPLLADRWSPRAFDTDYQLDAATLTALLEAARWAPSASNSQPWRFLVSRRGDDAFDQLAGLLAPGNRSWAPNASALALVAARTTNDAGEPQAWALYDTGQAVAALTVQAQAEGLHVHQLGGFDADAAGQLLDAHLELTPVVVIAIGRHDPQAVLPAPLAEREVAPRTRQPLATLILMAGATRRDSDRAA